jgi:PhoH-like ATPase
MGQIDYVIDTNIIFNEPYILNKFENCNIYIPGVVLEELDKYKYDKDLGIQVRIFGRILDKLYENNNITDNGCKIIFMMESYLDKDLNYLGGSTNDNRIIHCCKLLNEKEKVILLSNDILVRSKSRAIGIEATGLTQELNNNISDDFYKGYIEYTLEDELVNTLYNEKFLSLNYFNEIKSYPHMFIILRPFSNPSKYLIGKVDKRNLCIELIHEIDNVYGISPKNIQQLMAFHLLLDPEIPLVVLEGSAGTGKTLLSLASGLQLVENQEYKKLLIAKPTVDSSNEIGFLPGNMDEKLKPYLQSYYDNLEFLIGEEYKNLEMLNIEINALNYMRGRSIPEQFIIIDEVQNLSKKEIKTMLTRAGDKTKIILLGDINQIDNKQLDLYNNGLSHVIEKFKGDILFGYIKLEKGVRSDLASKAAKLL